MSGRDDEDRIDYTKSQAWSFFDAQIKVRVFLHQVFLLDRVSCIIFRPMDMAHTSVTRAFNFHKRINKDLIPSYLNPVFQVPQSSVQSCIVNSRFHKASSFHV